MHIRNMTYSDINFAFNCTCAEGWSGETKEVFKSFISYDQQGCLIAELASKNIGMCVATKYKNSGFIGELIIIKEMRGQGFGSKLFTHSLQYLRSKGIRNIYLDGDLSAVPIYEKHGFKKITKSLRFVGKIKGKSNLLVRKATSADLSQICKIDAELFGEDRGFFLESWQDLFSNYCFVIKSDNTIRGYIMGRPGTNVISVGPIAVLTEDVNPIGLLEALALEAGKQTLRIGVLESNKKAVQLFRSIKTLKEGVPSWRMVLGQMETLGQNEKLYAIGSAAKG